MTKPRAPTTSAKYQEAIEEYQKAYEIGGDAAMIYNIAQAYRLSDQLSEAIRFYRRYLQRSPNAPNREIVERRIAELEKVVDERKKTGVPMVPVAPMPTPLPTPPIGVTPPPGATAPGDAASDAAASRRAGRRAVVPIEPAPHSSGGIRARTVVAIVVMGVGAGLGVWSFWREAGPRERPDKLTSQSQMGERFFSIGVEDNGKTANRLAIILGIASGVAIAAGGVVLLTGGSSSSSVEALRRALRRLVVAGDRNRVHGGRGCLVLLRRCEPECMRGPRPGSGSAGGWR